MTANKQRIADHEEVTKWLRKHSVESMVIRLLLERHTTLMEVCGRSREIRISTTRQELWRFLIDERAFGAVEVARLFCRDHSTVYVGVQAARNRRVPLWRKTRRWNARTTTRKRLLCRRSKR